MTFGLPIAATSLATIGAVLTAAAVIAYVLKQRRRQFEVPFSNLWQRVLRETPSSALWRRLKRPLSLLLLLLMLALLLMAAADPTTATPDENIRHQVIIIDTSASMTATDTDVSGAFTSANKSPRRIDAAIVQARLLIESLGPSDVAMLVRMDGRATPLTRFTRDKTTLVNALHQLEPSHTPADLRSALALASDALREHRQPRIVLIGDGAYPPHVLSTARFEPADAGGDITGNQRAYIDLSNIDVRFVPIGTSRSNVGITAFNVRRYVTNRLSYEVFIDVKNFGDTAADVELTLQSGNTPIEVKQLSIPAGASVRTIAPNLGSEGHRLRAIVTSSVPDAFALDNEAVALLPTRTRQRVLLVSEDNLYLEGALLVYDNIAIDKLTPAEYDRTMRGPSTPTSVPQYDVVIFDGHTPAKVPEDAHQIYFAPSGKHSPFPVLRTLKAPRITNVRSQHPVMKWLELGDVNFGALSVFEIAPTRGDIVLARSLRAPVIAARAQAGVKTVALGFTPANTDIVLRVAWPLLLVNALDWLSGDNADFMTTYVTGQKFRVPIDVGPDISEVTVQTPTGQALRAPVTDGFATFYSDHVGIHRLRAPHGGPQLELAANLANPTESTIAPVPVLELGGRVIAQPDLVASSNRHALWVYVVLAALILLLIEWWTYHRRVTL